MSQDAARPHHPPSASTPKQGGGEALPEIDVRERGAEKDGQPQAMNRRLFMQFLAFELDGGPFEQAMKGLAKSSSWTPVARSRLRWAARWSPFLIMSERMGSPRGG